MRRKIPPSRIEGRIHRSEKILQETAGNTTIRFKNRTVIRIEPRIPRWSMVIWILSSVIGPSRSRDRARGWHEALPWKRNFPSGEARANPSYHDRLRIAFRIYRLASQRDRFLMVFGASPSLHLLRHINPFAAITVKGSLIINSLRRPSSISNVVRYRDRAVCEQILFQRHVTEIIEDLGIYEVLERWRWYMQRLMGNPLMTNA